MNYLDKFANSIGKYDLKKIKELVKIAKIDLSKIKFVHVTGTNGKGSTSRFIAAGVREQGFKTGLYTSPHLIKANERIEINGKQISNKELNKLCKFFEPLVKKMKSQPSYFELFTAIAFKYFSGKKVDYCVLEVGLGGRLDATNIIAPEVSVITNVGLEHTQFLGTSISKIASEKAAIIKQGRTCITLCKNEALKVVKKKCHKKKSKLIIPKFRIKKISSSGNAFDLISPFKIKNIKTIALGKHQVSNAAIAASVLKLLKISNEKIKAGLKKVRPRARLEIVSKKPLVLIDAAHNVDGIKSLVESLKLFKFDKLITVFGVLETKNWKEMISMIGNKSSELVFTTPESDSALDPEKLRKFLGKGIVKSNPKTALKYAKKLASKNDLVLACGSIYMVGKVLNSR